MGVAPERTKVKTVLETKLEGETWRMFIGAIKSKATQ
jgi:hypothetical protein